MASPQERGRIESAQRLIDAGGRSWSQQELLAACERAVLRNTGWPIGLVLQRSGLAPIPTPDGIEARLTHHTTDEVKDFWSLRKDGSYYVSRAFEEDFEANRATHPIDSNDYPERFIWFDMRIWRIAEVILHSATLYRELGVPPDEPYILAVNHERLAGREFYVSNQRRHVRRGRFCQSASASWVREVTQDHVNSELKVLVQQVTDDLFVLFDFAEISEEVVHEIVGQFLTSRV